MHKNVIIEIGGFDGEDTEFYSKNKNTIVYCFEPNKECADKLRKRFKYNKNVNIIEKAVGNFNGKTKFYVTKKRMSSSIHKPSQYSIDNNIIEIENSYDVDIIKLETFINENKIESIEYFHCDAQGSDLDILISLGNKISIIKKGQVEGSRNENLYLTENRFFLIIEYLEKNQFIILNKKEIEERKNWKDLNIVFVHKKQQKIL